jgi:AcrR family transcriptional regulator
MEADLPLETKQTKSWSRRKTARPGEILDAALKVFAEKGYAAARMEDIAQAACVTKGTIYLYFQNKEDVFKTLAREFVGRALADAARQMKMLGGTPRERLVIVLNGIAAFLNSDERIIALPKVIIAESGNFPELARFWRSEIIDRAITMITQTLEQGMASGEFRRLPSDYVAKMCIAPILLGVIWRTTFAPLSDEPFDPQVFLDTHIDMLLHGLERVPKSGDRFSDRTRDETDQRVPKSGDRFSDRTRDETDQRVPKSGDRFSDRTRDETDQRIPKSGDRFSDRTRGQRNAPEGKTS